MSPWQLVGELGIYTEEQIEDMTWAECVEILEAEYQNMENRFNNMVEIERMLQFLDIQEVTTRDRRRMVRENSNYQSKIFTVLKVVTCTQQVSQVVM